MEPRPARSPDDEFGDDRWRSDARESAVARAHPYVFQVALATLRDAESLADRLRSEGVSAQVGEYGGDVGFPWQLTVTATLRPWAVATFAHHLGALAGLLRGKLVDEGRPLEPGSLMA